MQSADITPAPDDDERKAILAALADEEASPASGSDWAAGALPRRDGEDDAP
ncbi:MAG TPA: hypothetical protein VFJ11_04365 [Gaiellaceae bacterium]|nr:hypothetical protein [Gaiellaceae bacterium]